jgi:hypothetical protein
MKIKYSFVTGETCEIEANNELSTMIMTIEHESSAKDRAETRRHHSIEALAEQGTEIADYIISVDKAYPHTGSSISMAQKSRLFHRQNL